MKKIIAIAFFLAPLMVAAQDLSSFQMVANYTLIDTAADALGMQPDIQLINSPFSGAEGVYCNGNYLNGGPDSSLVETPEMDALYQPSFAIQVEFNIENLDNNTRPVLICGDSWRYLGFQIKLDSTFVTEFNGYTYDLETPKPAEANRWYDLTIIYSGPDSTAYWYLDGNLIAERSGKLDRPENDGNISNTHFGSGKSFKGHLRNLRVYQSDGIFSATGEAPELDGFRISPNPAGNYVSINGVPSGQYHWTVIGMNGRTLKTGASTGNGQRIWLEKLPAGQYFLRLTNAKTGAGQSRMFIKN